MGVEQAMPSNLRKRRRIVLVFFFVSLVILLLAAVYGIKSVSAISFLIQQEEVGSADLLHTIKFWCVAFILSVANHVVIFATWYLSDRRLN